MLRDENGLLTGYVYVDVAGRDVGSYVAEAKRVVASSVQLPPGYSLAWSGQYEAMERVRERLAVVLPLTLFLMLHAALPEHAVDGQDRDHRARRAVLGGRRDLAALRCSATT